MRQSHRVKLRRRVVGDGHFAHEITHAFIRRQVIIKTPVRRLADPRFFRAATPVTNIVARAESGETSEVVAIHFARMPRHGLGESKNIGTPRAQKRIPQPHIRPQFGVVPSHPAQVVTPHMTIRIITVHEIAEIPEAIPTMLFHGLLIKSQRLIEAVFDGLLKRSRTIRQTPQPEGLRLMQDFGWAHQDRRRAPHVRLSDGLGLGRNGGTGKKREFARARDSGRRAEPGLHVLINRLESMRFNIVVA